MTSFGSPPSHPVTTSCYRHDQTPAVTTCNRCNRPICTSCMVSAPVGWQCEHCVAGHARAVGAPPGRPVLTIGIIGVNVAVFIIGALLSVLANRAGSGLVLGGGSDSLAVLLGLHATPVAMGEWWRIITSGFLHFGLMHLGFNMMVVWIMGDMLEPRWGHLRFGFLYLASLLGGSLGALILSPRALTGGASGAAFGLMAAAFVASRFGGRNALRAQVGGMIVANLFFTFLIPNISIGGHVGGLLGGALVALLYEVVVPRLSSPRMSGWVGAALAAVVSVVLFGACLVAGGAIAV